MKVERERERRAKWKGEGREGEKEYGYATQLKEGREKDGEKGEGGKKGTQTL